jgi:uncharacterized protein (TIGR03435 family)
MRIEPRELLAVGIFGRASLSGRIEALLKRGRESSTRASRPRIAASAAILLTFAAASALAPRWIAFAQQPNRPSFEVASIKPCAGNAGGRSGAVLPSLGRLNLNCPTVAQLIQQAYVYFANGRFGLSSVQVSGGPAWLSSARYLINAKAEGNPRLEIMSGPMLQTLLEDRFRLTIHRETREVPVYALEVATGGVKLPPVAEGTCVILDMDKALTPRAPGQQHPDFCGTGGVNRRGAKVTVHGHAMTLDEFSGRLRLVSDRPIVNKTAIAGMFDFHLEFVSDEAATGLAPPDDASGPSMFTAIQEQLGLKLEPTRGPGEFLVIDHVEKPDAN